MKKNMRAILIALSCTALLFACANPLDMMKGSSVPSGYGKVSIGFAGQNGQRTVYPSKVFQNYVYTFTKDGGSPQQMTTVDGTFTLEMGSYTVTVDAYVGAVAPTNKAATGTANFVLASKQTQSVSVTLQAQETTGAGTFAFDISYPDEAVVRTLTLQKLPDLTNVALSPTTTGTSSSGTLTVPSGYYLLTVLLQNKQFEGLFAGEIEVVHIYDKLTSTYDKTFAIGDFAEAWQESGVVQNGPYAMGFDWTTNYDSYSSVAASISGNSITMTGGNPDAAYPGSNANITGAPVGQTAIDIEKINGITFTPSNDGKKYRIVFLTPGTEEPAGWNHYGYTFTANGQPVVINIPGDLDQARYEDDEGEWQLRWGTEVPFNQYTITGIQFRSEEDGDFNLTISNLQVIAHRSDNIGFAMGFDWETQNDSLSSASANIANGAISTQGNITSIDGFYSNYANITGYADDDTLEALHSMTKLGIYVQGDGQEYYIQLRTSDFEAANNYNFYRYSFIAPTEPTFYVIDIVDTGDPDDPENHGLYQGDWGGQGPFIQNNVYGITFQHEGSGNFNLKVLGIYPVDSDEGIQSTVGSALGFDWESNRDPFSQITASINPVSDTITMSGTKVWQYTEIIGEPSPAMPEVLADLHSMSYVRLTVIGDGNDYRMAFQTPETVASGYNHFGKTFSTTNGVETTVIIRSSELTQPTWGGTATFFQGNIERIQFGVDENGPFNLTISNIEFVQPSDFRMTYKWLNQGEEMATVEGPSPDPLTLSGNDTLTIHAAPGFVPTRWSVNGVSSVQNGGTSYTFSAAGKASGTYSVNLMATKDGRSYNVNLTVTVTGGGDNLTWTTVADSTFGSSSIFSITYGNGKFIAGGTRGKIAYSSDGIVWTAVADSTFASSDDLVTVNAITWGNDKFVAVASGGMAGNGKMAYSSDGIAWTAVGTSTFGNAIFDIAYGGSKFVAVGNDGKIAYSSDGIAWTAVANSTFASDNLVNGVAYGNGKFVAVSEDGTMAYSTDGISWTAVTNSTFGSSSIGEITYGNNKFVAIGNSGDPLSGYSGKMAYSTDGITWTAVADSTFGSFYISRITYGDNKFVAVGHSGDILSGLSGKMAYSTDGITWTATNNTFNASAIAWGNNKFVAGGVGGQMAYSN